MACRKRIGVYCENHTKHKNTGLMCVGKMYISLMANEFLYLVNVVLEGIKSAVYL